MPLFIRDKSVVVLAKRLQQRLNAPSKTVAVRIALQNELQRLEQRTPLRERIKKYQDMAAFYGPLDPNFDDKAVMDDISDPWP